MKFRGQRFGKDRAQGPDEGAAQRAQLPGQDLFLSRRNPRKFTAGADAGCGVHPFFGNFFPKIFSFFPDVGILEVWIDREKLASHSF
jgi:hypothetical protein